MSNNTKTDTSELNFEGSVDLGPALPLKYKTQELGANAIQQQHPKQQQPKNRAAGGRTHKLAVPSTHITPQAHRITQCNNIHQRGQAMGISNQRSSTSKAKQPSRKQQDSPEKRQKSSPNDQKIEKTMESTEKCSGALQLWKEGTTTLQQREEDTAPCNSGQPKIAQLKQASGRFPCCSRIAFC
ncbi:unnamed protein product [Ilex paraguariensis]|uniref:Uncharacterized protein n=1 Tax=Ilex paraguariensis TaxID=185542 RepID=A0ABC8SZW2_9AQUA